MRIKKFNESLFTENGDIEDILLEMKDMGAEYVIGECWVNPENIDSINIFTAASRAEIPKYYLSYCIDITYETSSFNFDIQCHIDFYSSLKNITHSLKMMGDVRSIISSYTSENDTFCNNVAIMVITDKISKLGKARIETLIDCIRGYCSSNKLDIIESSTNDKSYILIRRIASAIRINVYDVYSSNVTYRNIENLCKGKVDISNGGIQSGYLKINVK